MISGTNSGELVNRVQVGEDFVEFRLSKLVCEKCGQNIFDVRGLILGASLEIAARFPVVGHWCAECYTVWLNERKTALWDQAQRDHALRSIPADLWPATWENFDPSPDRAAFEAAYRWAKHPGGFLVLWGTSGNGKSHLAAAAVRQVVKNQDVLRWNRTVEFIKVPVLIDRLRRSQRREESSVVDDYTNIPNLILDDIGAERSTEFALEQLYLLIDGRLAKKRPTLFTCNLHPKEVAEKIGERLASRIFMGKCVELSGRDRRLLTGGKP